MANHAHLNNLISEIKVTKETAYKTFFSVASQIFADGTVNWGRICTLFYFAYKLAIQVLKDIPLLDIIFSWVKKFVAQKVAKWISDRGGWVSFFFIQHIVFFLLIYKCVCALIFCFCFWLGFNFQQIN